MNNKLIPQYRFPEFKNDGSWEISSLSDKIDYERPDEYIVKNTNYLSKGIPVLTANKSFILGYTDENEGIYEDNLPVIIFDDFTVDNKYVNFPFKVKSSAIKILKNKNEDDSLKFFYELMSQIKFEAKEHKRYYISAYQKIQVPVPTNPAEQQKIAACLSNLDELIAAHEEKLKALEEHKKGLMQNLFPQEGKTQPKYRFPEFENDGDWVEKKLSEIGVLVNGLTYSPNDVSTEGILVLRSSNVQNSTISLEDNVYVNKTINEVNPIKLGDILICVRNGSKSLIGKNALIRKDMPNTTHGAFMTVFRSQQFEFVYQLFQSDLFFKQVHTDLGATINSINGKNLLNYKFVIPKNPLEQQKIASVLSSMDELIVAQREKIEALKAHKKGLMQGLFPKIES